MGRGAGDGRVRKVVEGRGRGTHLQPDDDEVPKTDHAEFGGGVSYPRLSVLDGNDIHAVQNELKSHDAHNEANEVVEGRPPFNT